MRLVSLCVVFVVLRVQVCLGVIIGLCLVH